MPPNRQFPGQGSLDGSVNANRHTCRTPHMVTLEALMAQFLVKNKTHPDLRESLLEEVTAWVEKLGKLDVSRATDA